MTVWDVQGEILQALGDELEPIGFRVDRKSSHLIRKIAAGEQYVSIAFFDYYPVYKFKVMTSILFNEIEDLYHASGAHDRPRTSEPVWIHGIQQSYFFDGLPLEYAVESSEDIEKVFDRLRPYILEKMIPFFQQCDSVESLEDIVNAEENLCTSHRFPYDACTAIMCAYLANPARFDAVVKKHSKKYIPDMMKKLIAYLRAQRG